jgi:hypothetical protein
MVALVWSTLKMLSVVIDERVAEGLAVAVVKRVPVTLVLHTT